MSKCPSGDQVNSDDLQATSREAVTPVSRAHLPPAVFAPQ